MDLEDLAIEAMELEALAMELRLNELSEIRKERGELSLGSKGEITEIKLRKLTQLTHGVRKSAWQRYGREKERLGPLGEMCYGEREREREGERERESKLIFSIKILL